MFPKLSLLFPLFTLTAISFAQSSASEPATRPLSLAIDSGHSMTLGGWLLGLIGISLGLGSITTWGCWRLLHQYFEKTKTKKGWKPRPEEIERIPLQPILIGILERLFFTILVAFNVTGVAGGIFAWMAVKMVAGWNRIPGGEAWQRMLAFNGLLCNLISLLFAVIGGLIANGNIPLLK